MHDILSSIVHHIMYILANIHVFFGVEFYKVVGIILSILAIRDKPYAVLGFFATRKFPPAVKQHKYAICIPARNEENVIGNLIRSIQAQDYPQELLTIFVVADNCTDKTAEVARELGAICYERQNPDERTKGYALRFLFDKIGEDYGRDSFEGYFIFDSDNLLAKDYVLRMNESFDAGEKIITSYRNTKNLNESWIASTYALHWLRSIRGYHRARSVLRLATNIQGTGFLFSNEIVKDGWKYVSLTEDRALTADCVVEGYKISYNDAAVFYDEQPTSLKIALRQRLRWSKGHLLAFAESGFGLFKHIFIDHFTKRYEDEPFYHFALRSLRYRWMSFDTFAQLVPKNVINVFRWILCRLILYPTLCYTLGMPAVHVLANGTYLSQFIRFIGLDPITPFVMPGTHAYLWCLALTIWLNFWFRVGRYVQNMPIAIYLFFMERGRMQKTTLKQKALYTLTWPTFDIIGRWTQYLAVFKKVEWKPIPHNSKITIDEIDVPKAELNIIQNKDNH